MVTAEPVQEPCPCSACTSPIVEYDEFGRVVMNNLHGKLRPCEECGRAKTEHRDYGTSGEMVCWWCNERAADPGELE